MSRGWGRTAAFYHNEKKTGLFTAHFEARRIFLSKAVFKNTVNYSKKEGLGDHCKRGFRTVKN
jgi:hypothetical protein